MRRSRLILLVFVLGLTLFFIGGQSKNGDSSQVREQGMGWLASVYKPFFEFQKSTSGFVTGIWSQYIALVSAQKENQALKKEVAILQVSLQEARDRASRVKEREDTDSLLKKLQNNGVVARVLAYDPQASLRTLWLDVGKDKGIMPDDTVLRYEGLVGRILRVYEDTSQVLLVVDPHFVVDVRNVRSGLRALIRGFSGSARLVRFPVLSRIEFVSGGSTFLVNDLMVTSGFSGLYPAGIPVGIIHRVQGDSIEILPQVDFARLREVVVLPQGKHKQIPTEAMNLSP
jgi:rod shape-determining protein MreC